jgi:hypothetical protein
MCPGVLVYLLLAIFTMAANTFPSHYEKKWPDKYVFIILPGNVIDIVKIIALYCACTCIFRLQNNAYTKSHLKNWCL